MHLRVWVYVEIVRVHVKDMRVCCVEALRVGGQKAYCGGMCGKGCEGVGIEVE